MKNKFIKILREKYSLIVIFIFIFLMSFIFPKGGDDYVNRFVYKTEYKMENIFDVLSSTLLMYIEWSGRIVPNFLSNLFLLFGKIPYAIANALIFIMILKNSFLLLERYNEKIKNSNIDYLILFLLNCLLIPVFTQDYIGLTSSISYSWTLFLLILYINHLEYMFNDKKLTTKTFIFSFLIGLTNEIVVIFINVFILFRMLKYKKINYVVLISLWTGSIIETFAPGNFKRMFYSSSQKNSITVFEKYIQFLKMEHTILILKILVFLLLLYIIKYYLYEKKKVYISLDLIIISGITLFLQIIIMPRNEPRAYLVSFYFLILSIFYFLKLLFIDNKNFYHFSRIIAYTVLFVLFFKIIPYLVIVRNLENERLDLIKYYINEGLKEVVFYENENVLNKIDSSYRAYELFSLNPKIFTNVYFSKYYGFDKVYGIPRKSKLFIIEFENGSKFNDFEVILDKGEKTLINNLQIDDTFLITIPEESKEIELRGKEFKIKKIKIIEVRKGITLKINKNSRKVKLY